MSRDINSVDMTGLDAMIRRIVKETGVPLRDVVKRQAGLLAMDLMRASPPKKKGKLDKQIAKDVGRGLIQEDRLNIPVDRRGKKDVRWVRSTARTLEFVDVDDYKPNADAAEATRLYYRGMKRYRKNHRRQTRHIGDAYRGVQKVFQINRTVVSNRSFREVMRTIKNKVGKFKAGWVVGLKLLSVAAKPPKWVQKHVESKQAPGTYINNLNHPGRRYSFTLINRAIGVTRARTLYMKMVQKRIVSIKKDLQLFAKGIKEAHQFR